MSRFGLPIPDLTKLRVSLDLPISILELRYTFCNVRSSAVTSDFAQQLSQPGWQVMTGCCFKADQYSSASLFWCFQSLQLEISLHFPEVEGVPSSTDSTDVLQSVGLLGGRCEFGG